jgi:hypothetical protein
MILTDGNLNLRLSHHDRPFDSDTIAVELMQSSCIQNACFRGCRAPMNPHEAGMSRRREKDWIGFARFERSGLVSDSLPFVESRAVNCPVTAPGGVTPHI